MYKSPKPFKRKHQRADEELYGALSAIVLAIFIFVSMLIEPHDANFYLPATLIALALLVVALWIIFKFMKH